MQIIGEVLRRFEVIDVDVGFHGGLSTIVIRVCPHHDGQDVVAEAVDEELLGDVVSAVGVLEGQVELVVSVEHLEALGRVGPRAPLGAARAEDVHPDVITQLLGVLKAVVARSAVRHEPRHLLRLVRRVVDLLRLLSDRVVVVHPLLVGCHDVRVVAVGGGPVEDVSVGEVLGVERTLEHEHDPHLPGVADVGWHTEVVLEHDGVRGRQLGPTARQHAGVDGAAQLQELSAARPQPP